MYSGEGGIMSLLNGITPCHVSTWHFQQRPLQILMVFNNHHWKSKLFVNNRKYMESTKGISKVYSGETLQTIESSRFCRRVCGKDISSFDSCRHQKLLSELQFHYFVWFVSQIFQMFFQKATLILLPSFIHYIPFA